MKAHRLDASSAPFRSGSDEEQIEATQLLDDLIALEDDRDTEDEETFVKARGEVERALAGDIVHDASLTGTSKRFKRAKSEGKRKGDWYHLLSCM